MVEKQAKALARIKTRKQGKSRHLIILLGPQQLIVQVLIWAVRLAKRGPGPGLALAQTLPKMPKTGAFQVAEVTAKVQK